MNSAKTKSFGVLTSDLALEIDKIIDSYQSNSTKLVGILLDIQDIIRSSTSRGKSPFTSARR